MERPAVLEPENQAGAAIGFGQAKGGGGICLPKKRDFWIHVSKDQIPAGWIGTPGLDLMLNNRKFTVTADPQTLTKLRGNDQEANNVEYAIIASESAEEVELQHSINASYLCRRARGFEAMSKRTG